MSKEHKYIEYENLGKNGNDFSNLSFLIIDLNILLICLSLPGRGGVAHWGDIKQANK